MTIESVQRSDFKDYEMIVVDGGSTDGTLDYLKSLRFSQLRFISEPDTGIYNAMNKGISLSEGEYLCFLNAGDFLTGPEALAEVANRLEGHLLYYFDVILKNGTGEIVYRNYPKKWSIFDLMSLHICHQAMWIKKSAFVELGSYNESYRFAADYEFTLRLLAKCPDEVKLRRGAFSVFSMDGVSSNQKNSIKIHNEFQMAEATYWSSISIRLGRLWHQAEAAVGQPRSVISRIYTRMIRRTRARTDFVIPTVLGFWNATRVLHLSTGNKFGGAMVAASRLHGSLHLDNIFSQMAVLEANSALPAVIEVKRYPFPVLVLKKIWIRILDRLIVMKMGPGFYSHNLFSYTSTRHLKKLIQDFNPDIVHLHWICARFLSLRQLKAIGRPIVWTFHDMWPFLGVEHVTTGVDFANGYAGSGRFSPNRVVLNQKKQVYRSFDSKSVFVAPSQWMKNHAQLSPAVAPRMVHVIGNIVDQKQYLAVNFELARKALRLSLDEKIVLFGAASPFIDGFKGYDTFCDAVSLVREKYGLQVSIVTFGSNFGIRSPQKLRHKHFEYINDPEFMSLLYSAANATVVASPVESFCLVAAESLACGTPVAAFKTSGLIDIIADNINGSFAREANAVGLAEAIVQALKLGEDRESLAKTCRSSMDKFDSVEVLKKYAAIYDNIMLRAPQRVDVLQKKSQERSKYSIGGEADKLVQHAE